jgi:hypothetical protein
MADPRWRRVVRWYRGEDYAEPAKSEFELLERMAADLRAMRAVIDWAFALAILGVLVYLYNWWLTN